MSAANVLKFIKEKEAEFVDLRFTDPRGKLQHLTMDVTVVDVDVDVNVDVDVDAEEKLVSLEYKLYQELINKLFKSIISIQLTAKKIAFIVWMIFYSTVSLTISSIINFYNRKLKIVER